MSLRRFAEQHLEALSPLRAANTVRITRRALELLEAFAGPAAALGALDRAGIERWRAWLLSRQYRKGPKGAVRQAGPNGARIIMRAARAAFRKALRDGLLDRDPFFGVELPPEVDVAHPPTQDEVHLLWPKIPARSRKALAVAAYLGLRRSEVCWLKAEDLTPPAGPKGHWTARVLKAKTRRGRVEFKEIAVPREALAALSPLPKSGPIVRVSPSLLNADLRRACREAGLGRIRLHDFRHRWATEFMSAVKDEYALMQSGGWTSRAAVSRYQHATEARRRANLEVGPRIGLPTRLPQKVAGGRSGGGRSPS